MTVRATKHNYKPDRYAVPNFTPVTPKFLKPL